jgi:N-acetylglucosamine-6-sulfatase
MRRDRRRISRRVTAFRRRLLIAAPATLGVAGALGVVGSGSPPATHGQANAAQARPNIVVIETDDQTVESMRVMNNVQARIGARGATFKNSFVNYSLCCPSRATFLTGQYAHNHGVLGNVPPNGGFPRFQELHGDNNLAVWLRNAGYYTAMVGKYLNGYANQPRVLPGWAEWYATNFNDQDVYNYKLNENGTVVQYGEDPADFKQDVLTRKAVGFVNRTAPSAQPFFLWLTYTAPHEGNWGGAPMNYCLGVAAKPAPRHAHAFDSEPLPQRPNFNEYDVSDKPAEIRNRPLFGPVWISELRRMYRCQLGSLLSVDEGVENIVRALVANSELNNTLIIYTSDNGFFNGEHRLSMVKRHIYEESIRVPLMMRGPGIPPGVTIPDLSINADLAPTIVDVANATPALVMDGRSLIPVAQQPGIEQGRALLMESAGYYEQPSYKAIRTQRYMYAEHGTGEKELYDLQNDPFELQSRHNAPAYASVKALLAARLDELRNCAGTSCRTHP